MAASGAPPPAGVPPATSSSSSSSGLPPPPPPPKILLAKPVPGSSAAPRLVAREEDPSGAAGVVLRSRNAPQPGSLNLLSESSWDVHTERILPFLTENTDFTVVGIVGPTGAGKSTIMNELYGFDERSPGMLPPFVVQSDETKAMAKHCTTGIELRVSAERLILLDTQPVFCPSILVDMMRPDGSSTVPVLNGESLSADLAHELMGIQLGVFLASICNVLLVVSEGINDFDMWNLMLTVDLLKHGIPDPSLLSSGQAQGSTSFPDKENKSNVGTTEEYLADTVFVHTKLQGQELSPSTVMLLKEALLQYFKSSSLNENKSEDLMVEQMKSDPADTAGPDLFCLPLKVQDELQKAQFESYSSMLGKLRDQLLSMNGRSFAKAVSERDWLRNSAKIWELVKKSPVVTEYCKTLQSSGLYRR